MNLGADSTSNTFHVFPNQTHQILLHISFHHYTPLSSPSPSTLSVCVCDTIHKNSRTYVRGTHRPLLCYSRARLPIHRLLVIGIYFRREGEKKRKTTWGNSTSVCCWVGQKGKYEETSAKRRCISVSERGSGLPLPTSARIYLITLHPSYTFIIYFLKSVWTYTFPTFYNIDRWVFSCEQICWSVTSSILALSHSLSLHYYLNAMFVRWI